MRVLLVLLSFIMIPQTFAKIAVHGHRGARAMMPENTLPAFEYAIGIGVEALELDLAVTKDNVLVVSHDPELSEKICVAPAGVKTRVIRQLTLAEVTQFDCGAIQSKEFPKQKAIAGTRVPTFEEVLALAPKGKFEFNVETKIFPDKPELTPSPAEFVRLVVAAVRKYKLESRMILQSFDWRTLEEMKKQEPKIRTSALYPSGMSQAVLQMDYVAEAKKIKADMVSPHYRTTTAEKVAQAHAAGMQVVPWTANDAATWQKLVDAKVDAIISDDPAALMAWLKEKGLR